MNFHQKPITFVSHVHLKVEDLIRSVQFYKEVVGFTILEQTKTLAKLTADGKNTLLTIEQPEDVLPQQGRATGLYHFAILLPKRSDLADFVYHCVERGIRLGSSDHLVSEALYFHDPDGNGIEVYTDRDPSTWIWQDQQVKMAVDPLDFEDLLKQGSRHGWKGLPKDTVMGHIHLHVADLATTEEFYRQGLGFEVVERFSDQALFISTGKYHHHIGLNTWNGVGAPRPVRNSVGLKCYTIKYPDKATLQKVATNLKAIGAKVDVKEGKLVTEDPSGNQIILSI